MCFSLTHSSLKHREIELATLSSSVASCECANVDVKHCYFRWFSLNTVIIISTNFLFREYLNYKQHFLMMETIFGRHGLVSQYGALLCLSS